MIKADTPSLWEIRTLTDHATAVAIIVKALIHLSRLVNLPADSNLNRDQIGEVANDVIEEHGYLKPEEVKYILKQAVRENKIFGRLDYAVVMKWFEDYDILRTECCIDISDQEATQASNQTTQNPDAMSFDDYVTSLRHRADDGDKDAKERLKEIEALSKQPRLPTPEEKHQQDVEFFKWKHQLHNQNERKK